MKKKFFVALIFALGIIASTAVGVYAAQQKALKAGISFEYVPFVDGDFTFANNADGQSYVVTKYNGNRTSVVVPREATKDGVTKIVTEIGEYSFSGNKTIKEFILSDNIKKIGYRAFKDCTALNCADITNGVTELGQEPFDDCTALKDITIGSGLLVWGIYPFDMCSAIETIVVDPANPNFASVNNVLYSKNGKTLFRYPSAVAAANFQIPASVTKIEPDAFCCAKITGELNMPSALVEVGESAFEFCTVSKIKFNSTTTPKASAKSFAFANDLTAVSVPTLSLNAYITALNGKGFAGGTKMLLNESGNEVATYNAQAGIWQKHSQTIVFNTNGGNAIANMQKGFADPVTLPLPTKAGNTFDGWFSQADFSGSKVEWSQMPWIGGQGATITIHAKWIVESYTLDFDENGGSIVASITAPYGTALSLPAPVRTGYTFAGWFEAETSNNGSGTQFSFATMPDLGVNGTIKTLYAKWIPNTYTLDFDENGGSIVANITETCGSALSLPVSTKPDYTFAGWFETEISNNGSGTQFSHITMPDLGENGTTKTLYAKWEHNYLAFTEINGGAAYSVRAKNSTIAVNNPVIPSIYLDKPVTEIANSGFSECPNISGSLTIPNSVISIGDAAFVSCKGLTGVIAIPGSVKSIGLQAFSECGGTAFNVDAANTNYSNDSQGFLYNKNQTTLIQCLIGKIGSITIPNSVTHIEITAFYGCGGLTGALTIPNSVTSIGDGAFSTCTGLYGNISIGSGVTSIGGWAFDGCTFKDVEILRAVPPALSGTAQFASAVEAIWVPDESAVATYKANASWQPYWNKIFSSENRTFIFDIPTKTITGLTEYGKTLANITVPATIGGVPVDAIGGMAFAMNATVQSVVISEGISEIQDGINSSAAFDNCINLSSISFPLSLKYIGTCAFWRCSLVNVAFASNSSLQGIGINAFYGCGKLTSFTFGSMIRSIGTNAFASCNSLAEVEFLGTVPPTLGGSGHFPNETQVIWVPDVASLNNFRTKVLWQSYYNKLNTKALFSFAINGGDGGDGRGYDVYRSNDTISVNNLFIPSIYLGKPVIVIAYRAFQNCKSLTGTLTIPDSVLYIDRYAFSGCTGFSGNLIIPNSVTDIFEDAFNGCYNFNGGLTIGNSVTSIGDGAFYGCDRFTGNLIFPDGVIDIGERAFSGCRGFSALIFPNSVTYISVRAFDGYGGVNRELVLPNSLKYISDWAFYNCRFTGDLTIPNSVTGIGELAFSNCSGFNGTLTIGSGVKSIGERAFDYCSGFKSVTIGRGVTSIGDQAFNGCTFKEVDMQSAVPPTLNGINHFPASVQVIWVMDETALANYKANASWQPYWDKLNTKSIFTFTSIDNGNAYSVSARNTSIAVNNLVIPSIHLGKSVTMIANGGFLNCASVTGTLTLPNSVTRIDENAFISCRGLTGVLRIPDSVTSIGRMAFANCRGFTGSIFISLRITNIEELAFQACGGTAFNVSPYNANYSNDSQGFLYNKNQTTLIQCLTGKTGAITIPNSVTNIGFCAFFTCINLSGDLIIPNSVIGINVDAFNGCDNFTLIRIESEIPATCGENIFGSYRGHIVVPEVANIATYKNAAGWYIYSDQFRANKIRVDINGIRESANSYIITNTGPRDFYYGNILIIDIQLNKATWGVCGKYTPSWSGDVIEVSGDSRPTANDSPNKRQYQIVIVPKFTSDVVFSATFSTTTNP